MAHSRTAQLPIDHLLAEIAAFPLASESAFRHSLLQLDPALEDSTGTLWRDAEHELTRSFPSFSLDELLAFRDRQWFRHPALPDHSKSVPLATYLQALANDLLEARGAIAQPKPIHWLQSGKLLPPGNLLNGNSKARRRWRWFSFALPPDLLLASLAGRGGPRQVDTLCPNLRQRLRDEGFAEIHLHLGAGLDFSLLWLGLIHQIAKPETKNKDFASPGAVFEEGRYLGEWLIRAVLVRYFLAHFLFAQHRGQTGACFDNFWHEDLQPGLITELGSAQTALVRQAVRELACGRLVTPSESIYVPIQAVFRQITLISLRTLPGDPKLIFDADPIAIFFPEQSNKAFFPEHDFVSLGLEYIAKQAQDKIFACLFWQTIRIRNLYYRHVTQRPMIPGLQWFIRFYDHLNPAKKALSSALRLKSAANKSDLNQGLKSLEVRTSPDDSSSAMLKFIQNIKKANTSLPTLELAVVLHFAKLRGDKNHDHGKGQNKANWRDSHADPDYKLNSHGYRYAHFYNTKKAQEVSPFLWLLRHRPDSLQHIRGIDICTDELGIPTWVFCPFFQEIRDASNQALAILKNECNREIPPLRTTAHVGEDFVHILGGLRRIDEAIHYLQMREGDRLGHAVALGVNIEEWCDQAGQLPIMKEERLLDLIWEWSFYRRYQVGPSYQRIAFIESEIARLSSWLFARECSPLQLETFMNDLHEPACLEQVGFPHDYQRLAVAAACNSAGKGGHFNRRQFLLDFLTNSGIFRKGREIELFDPQAEAGALVELQQHLRRRVASLGLTVEVNPSSNLLIGNLADLTNHPLWRLSPPIPDENAVPINIAIGSDDPITFATSLPEEYQLVCDSLTFAGLAEKQVHEWINKVRAQSLTARFSLATRS